MLPLLTEFEKSTSPAARLPRSPGLSDTEMPRTAAARLARHTSSSSAHTSGRSNPVCRYTATRIGIEPDASRPARIHRVCGVTSWLRARTSFALRSKYLPTSPRMPDGGRPLGPAGDVLGDLTQMGVLVKGFRGVLGDPSLLHHSAASSSIRGERGDVCTSSNSAAT